MLSRTDYLAAEKILMQAEQIGWDGQDWDTLSRLYMPLQECRRQKRQIALSGTMLVNITHDKVSSEEIAERCKQGEVLIAGDGNISAGISLRRLAKEKELYLEAFLAAGYQIGERRAVVIVALENAVLPAAGEIQTLDQLLHRVPAHSLVVAENEIMVSKEGSMGVSPMSVELNMGETPMLRRDSADAVSLWERLHLPYLAAADAEVDPVRRMAGYRLAIQVDNGCELAHQKLADVAAKMR